MSYLVLISGRRVMIVSVFFFFQAEDGIRDLTVTAVQTCALPICVGDPVRTVSGTPPYQAPDANLTRWDVSTDLFAVGVTLYELLCDGNHPYEQSRPARSEERRVGKECRVGGTPEY